MKLWKIAPAVPGMATSSGARRAHTRRKCSPSGFPWRDCRQRWCWWLVENTPAVIATSKGACVARVARAFHLLSYTPPAPPRRGK